jgi:hypothetical protein
MGGVDFQYLVKPGNLPVTAFVDSFIGADRPFMVGDNWFTQCVDVNAVGWQNIEAQVNIGATGLTYGDGSGVNNSTTSVNFFPANVTRLTVVAKSLTQSSFAELTLVSRTIAGVTAGIGPSVLMQPGTALCYLIQWNSVNTNTVLFRRNANGTYTTIRANCFAAANGDTVRLEALYVGGFPQLKVYKNGVLQSTDLDNSGLGPANGGSFGLSLSGCFTGQITVSNFNGGLS